MSPLELQPVPAGQAEGGELAASQPTPAAA